MTHHTSLRPPRSPWILACCSFLLLTTPASAQLDDDEEWFDGPASVQPGSDRTVPDVAVGGNGRTVVAWQANTNGQDVWARVFEADGTPLANPFRVNVTTTDEQADPRVAAGPDGTFTVAWVNTFDPARGANEYSIRSRTYDADGTALVGEQIVNTEDPTLSGGTQLPDVAALAGGGFAVVWRSATFAGSADTGISIQGRLLNSTGVPTGSQFQVNSSATGNQNHPAVDALPADDPDGSLDGGFVVAWTQPDVHARRFQANGTSSETDLLVDTLDGERLDVAVDEATGHFVATWYRDQAVWARAFDDDLTPLTAKLRVSSASDTAADDPTITDIGQDGFYIAWNSDQGVGTDDEQDSIQARILGADGVFAGGQFQVNKWIASNQRDPRLASSNGRLGIVWRSSGNPVTGTGDDHILGYLLKYCDIFCDGFETGNTTRWN